MEIKRKQKEDGAGAASNDDEYTLQLSLVDKVKMDLLIYSLPIVIVGIAFWREVSVNFTDILQASAAFLLMIWWENMLFKKRAK